MDNVFSTNGDIRIENVLNNINLENVTVNNSMTNGKDIFISSIYGSIYTLPGKTLTGKNVTLAAKYNILAFNSGGGVANDYMNVAYTGGLILANAQGSGLPTGTVKIHHVNQGQYITY